MSKKQGKPFFEQRKNQFGLIFISFVVIAIFAFNQSSPKSEQIAYLYPFSGGIPNIWIASVDKPADARQLTDTKMGVHDFDVSQNGLYIAYTMRDEATRSRDIYLLDIQTKESRQITFCAKDHAECYSPAFHPQNTAIAYVKQSAVDDSHSVENIWLLDIKTGESRPLTSDSSFVGDSPQWSLDGNTLAFYNANLNDPKIIVYNFNPADGSPRTQYVATAYNGLVGSLAPHSLRLVFPDLSNYGDQAVSYLSIADFEQNPTKFENLSDPDGVDDIAAKWYPNGKSITIARRFLDSRWTQGYQLYEMNLETKDTTKLIYDENYSQHYFEWDNKGKYLVVQRVPVTDSFNTDSKPEVWVLNYESGELSLIAKEAYQPRWVNNP